MRDPENTVFGHPVLDAHRVIPHPDAGSREYRLYTAGNRPGSRDARPVHPTSNLYPQRSMTSFPLFFSRKRKGEAKRKLPADVRKLKNGCAVRRKRTRRARPVAAIQSAIPLRAPRPIHPGSNIFSPHSALSVIFLSAFSHRPEGLCALAAMYSTLCAGHRVMPHFDAASRDTDKIIRKIHFAGPRIAVRGDVKHRSAVRQR